MKHFLKQSGPTMSRFKKNFMRAVGAGICLSLSTSLVACNGGIPGIGGSGNAAETVSADQPYFSSKEIEFYKALEKEDCYIRQVIPMKDSVLVMLDVSYYDDMNVVYGNDVIIKEASVDGSAVAVETVAEETAEAADETAADETEADESVADETEATDAVETDSIDTDATIESEFLPEDVVDESYNKTVLLTYSLTGELLSTVEPQDLFDENSYLMNMGMDPDGNLVALVQSYDPESYEAKLLEYKLDKDGKISGEPTEVKFDGMFSPNNIVYDDAGNKYFAGYGEKPMVIVTDPDGKVIFEDSNDNLNSGFFKNDGKIYIDGYDVKGNYKYCFYEIDIAGKKLGEPVDMSFANMNGMIFSGPNGLYVDGSTGVNKVNMEEKKLDQILSWNDCAVEHQAYGGGSIAMVSDTSFMLFESTYDQESMRSKVKGYFLTKEATNPDAGKKIITVGGIGVSYDETLKKLIYEFNKTNPEYRMMTKDYEVQIDYSNAQTDQDYMKLSIDAYTEEIRKMNLDIISGDGPDILYGNTADYALYESKGLLVDLYPLMEKDQELTKDKFIPGVLKACESDGKLFKIGTSYYIYGLAGATSLIGDRTGWTLEEFQQIAGSLPDGMNMLSPYGNSQTNLLDAMFMMSMNTFIDKATGKANFDSEDFRNVMKFAKENGRDDDAVDDGSLYVDEMELIRNKELALTSAYIGNPMSYHTLVSAFGEPVSVVGYPSVSKTGAPCRMNTVLSISSESPSVDICWTFLKNFFTEEAQNKVAENWSIPVTRTALEKQITDAMNMKEEDMQMYYYDPSSQYKPMTQESADMYRTLAESVDTMIVEDPSMLGIIHEEVAPYFNDQKDAESVAKIIQNRIETLIKEK